MATKYNTIEEERKHPIIEDCEVMENGKVERKFMLSLNGMYISGITEEQLEELHAVVADAFMSTIPKGKVTTSKCLQTEK